MLPTIVYMTKEPLLSCYVSTYSGCDFLPSGRVLRLDYGSSTYRSLVGLACVGLVRSVRKLVVNKQPELDGGNWPRPAPLPGKDVGLLLRLA